MTAGSFLSRIAWQRVVAWRWVAPSLKRKGHRGLDDLEVLRQSVQAAEEGHAETQRVLRGAEQVGDLLVRVGTVPGHATPSGESCDRPQATRTAQHRSSPTTAGLPPLSTADDPDFTLSHRWWSGRQGECPGAVRRSEPTVARVGDRERTPCRAGHCGSPRPGRRDGGRRLRCGPGVPVLLPRRRDLPGPRGQVRPLPLRPATPPPWGVGRRRRRSRLALGQARRSLGRGCRLGGSSCPTTSRRGSTPGTRRSTTCCRRTRTGTSGSSRPILRTRASGGAAPSWLRASSVRWPPASRPTWRPRRSRTSRSTSGTAGRSPGRPR